MALVYEGERLLALTWCCFVFLCVEVVGANNGVEPLDDEDKKQQFIVKLSTPTFYIFRRLIFSLVFIYDVITLMGEIVLNVSFN